MGLENLNGRPLDYINDESGEKRGLYDNPNTDTSLPNINYLDGMDAGEDPEEIQRIIEDNLRTQKEELEAKKQELEAMKKEMEKPNIEQMPDDSARKINEEFREQAERLNSMMDSLFDEEDSKKHHF